MTLLKRAQALSIRTKLSLLIILFLCVPFICFGALWYGKSTETTERNAVASSQQLITQINNQLDSYFDDLERASLPVVTHSLIKSFMRLPKDDAFERFIVIRDIEREVLPNYMIGRPDIESFSLVTENGSASYGGTTSKEENLKLFRQYQDSTSFRIAGIRQREYAPVLTVVRTFRDADTYQTLGALVIDLRINQITRILEKVRLGKTGYIWILDSNANVLLHPEPGKAGKPADPELLEHLRNGQEGYFLKQNESGKTLVIYHRSAKTNWTMVSEVPLRELIGDLIHLRNVTLWVGIALILFVLAALTVFSYNLTRSLAVLQKLMKSAEHGELAVQAPANRKDEIGGLYRSFNHMVNEIRRLIEVVHTSKLKEKELQLKQREAMMQAMQSQINPHFLYNTLEVINSYAVIEGVMPISNMATSLADLFRYSAGSSKQIVTLKEELDHARTYMDIQKERYPYLSFECDIDDSLAVRVGAVRLIIQPLIENAIVHGYERHRLRPAYCGLSVELLDDCCLVRVIDRGRGMDEERKRTYDLIFHGAFEGDETELPFQRIGLLNVHHRIRLTYGDLYGLHIEQSDACGTVIGIRLPYSDHGTTHTAEGR